MRITFLPIGAAFLLALSAPAAAQVEMGSIPMWSTIGMLNQMSLDRSLRSSTSEDESDSPSPSRRASRRAAAAAAASEASPATGTRIPLAKPRMPAKMAQHYPPADRAKAQRVFDNMLAGYGQLARQLRVPEDDVAGAVAGFIAGSWMAYHDRDVADADFPVLVAQMRKALRSAPEFASATIAQKQDMREQLAILGTLMALTRAQLQRQPDARISASMRAAARSYLEGFLKMSPDSLMIDRRGLTTKG